MHAPYRELPHIQLMKHSCLCPNQQQFTSNFLLWVILNVLLPSTIISAVCQARDKAKVQTL